MRDFYQDMYDNKSFFDFGVMKEKFNDNTNKNVPGKFKNKTAGVLIKEFTRLRSKNI